MPFISPIAAGSVGPETITVTVSGSSVVGLLSQIRIQQTRSVNPIFGLNGRKAVLLIAPTLGQAELHSVVIPAEQSSNNDNNQSRLRSFVSSFDSNVCGNQSVTITANYSCLNQNVQIVLRNVVVQACFGQISNESFTFIQMLLLGFSGYG